MGGPIRLKSPLIIRHPFVTVAGQSAPGEGICIRADTGIQADTLVLDHTHDVILRHLRAQSGLGPGTPRADDGGDCISVYDSETSSSIIAPRISGRTRRSRSRARRIVTRCSGASSPRG